MSNVHYLLPESLMMNDHDLSQEALEAVCSLVGEAWNSRTELLQARIDDAMTGESGNLIRIGTWEITVRQVQTGEEIWT